MEIKELFEMTSQELLGLADRIEKMRLPLKQHTSFRWSVVLSIYALIVSKNDNEAKVAQTEVTRLLESANIQRGIGVNNVDSGRIEIDQEGEPGEYTVFFSTGYQTAHLLFCVNKNGVANRKKVLGLSAYGRKSLANKLPQIKFES